MTSAQLSPQPHKLFYRPGVLEQLEEDAIYEEPMFRLGTDSPILNRNTQNYLLPRVQTLNRVHTSPSLARISTATSLARVSTCNSSLHYVAGTIRHDSSRRSFRPNAVRKMRKRAVFKNGDCNIIQSRISKRRLRYLQDIFTTLVDSQWRWTLTIFAVAFLGSWLIFALIWWLIVFTHGDLEEDHLPIHQADSSWAPCVLNIYGFTSCFLFSIETQHTIGYGVRTTTEECPEAIFIMCLQSIAGMIIQAFMTGIVFAKMTRPKLRTQTLQFSKNAVICQREGYLCLMFRVGDMRKSHIIGASIRAQLIRARKTKEGEILSNFQTELTVTADGCDGNLFFIWPMTIVHKIDEESPFFYLSASDLLQERFEIVTILEGTIESTGQTTQARSSYLASEVLWGHRFEPVVCYNKDRQGYEVNYSKFDNTVAVDTPLCSSAELGQFYKMRQISGTKNQDSSEQTTSSQTPYSSLLDSPPQKHHNADHESNRSTNPSIPSGQKADISQSNEYFEFPDETSRLLPNGNLPQFPTTAIDQNSTIQPEIPKTTSIQLYPTSQNRCHDIPEEEEEEKFEATRVQQWRV